MQNLSTRPIVVSGLGRDSEPLPGPQKYVEYWPFIGFGLLVYLLLGV